MSARLVAGVAVVVLGLGAGGAPREVEAQGERRVLATATCVGETAEREPFVYVTVGNYSGGAIRLIAAEGFSTSRAFNPFFLEDEPGDLFDLTIPDGERVAVDARWGGQIGGDGEGLAAGAVVVTSMGVLTPICSDRPEDLGTLTLDDPIASDPDDVRLQEARYMAETLGRLEGWRAYPVLFALLHPDAQAAVGLGRLTCWYVDQYGGRLDPDRVEIVSTTVSVAEPEPWTWELNGETYDEAVSYSYEQEVGTVAAQETVSGTAHLARVDGTWRWFFGSSQEALEELPETCDVDAG